MPRRSLTRLTILTLALFVATSAVALGAGSRAGATRAATHHAITHIKRFGITLRPSDLDLQCSKLGRSRWWCFVYANDGQCTGTLVEAYSPRMHAYRARNIDIGCDEMTTTAMVAFLRSRCMRLQRALGRSSAGQPTETCDLASDPPELGCVTLSPPRAIPAARSGSLALTAGIGSCERQAGAVAEPVPTAGPQGDGYASGTAQRSRKALGLAARLSST